MDGERQIQKAYESILGHDFEQAIEWFEQAVALEPDNADYHYRLSITYARSNKLPQALEHARIAVKLDQASETYRYHLLHLLARELVQQAEPFFDREKGRLYMAVSLLKRAVELDPLCVEAFLLLALAYAGLDDYTFAVQAVKEVLKLQPEHELAKQLLQDYVKKLNRYLR